MFARIHDVQMLSAVLAAMVVGALTTAVAAQDDGPTRQSPKHYYVLDDDTPVRSNASSRAYVFGLVDRGDIVRAIDERDGWLRVAIVGPAFDEFFGYIKYRKGQEGRYEIDREAGTLTTLGIASIVAPNLDADNNPSQSWKAIHRLSAETDLEWIETRETDRERVQLVRLPEEAEGWINRRHVRSASQAEVRQWQEQRDDPDRRDQDETGDDSEDDAEQDGAGDESERGGDASQDGTQGDDAQSGNQADGDPGDGPGDQPETSGDDQPEDQQSDEPADERDGQLPSGVDDREGDEDADADAADGEAEQSTEDDESAVTLEDVEEVFERVRGDEIESAELRELQRLYGEVARQHDEDSAKHRFAQARIEQLDLRIEVQNRRRELRELRNRMDRAREDSEARRRALDAQSSYNIVGRLNTSTIYDGRRLPRMYRIQDPDSARTLAYIRPDEEFDLVGMLGQLVGVVGEKTYDGSLRLNLVEPRRIELLAETGE